jgi:hypothetical protein
MSPRWLWALGPLALAALAFGGCFEAPTLLGPYRCTTAGECGAADLVCDDGLCCRPLGEPYCQSYLLDGGRCADGGLATAFFADTDGDGWGNRNEPRYYCSKPVETVLIERGGDCNDAHPGVYPGAREECDGLDNDCDDQVDEGYPTRPFWPDSDNDGAGDRDAPAVQLCGPRVGFVENNADCDDGDALVGPGKPERCNGKDDDCDGQVDEAVAGLGQPCTISTLKGACAEGRTACTGGQEVCAQVAFPEQDRCNGQDEDCSGVADDRPGCGGPQSLLLPASQVSFGAQDLNQETNGGLGQTQQFARCLKNLAGASAEAFNGTRWTGDGATGHLAWFESSGNPWDLTRAGSAVRLRFAAQLANAGSPPWKLFRQPIIYLCDGLGGWARYVYTAGGTSGLLTTNPVTVDTSVPVAGGNGWSKTNDTLDERQVLRVEVLVEPNGNGTATLPVFTVDFLEVGFP